MISFIKAKDVDFQILSGWMREYGRISDKRLYPPTTYLCLVNDEPVLGASLVLTNVPGVVYIENVIGNPAEKEQRHEALPFFLKYLEGIARDYNAEHVIISTYTDGIKCRYLECGFAEISESLSIFVKNL